MEKISNSILLRMADTLIAEAHDLRQDGAVVEANRKTNKARKLMNEAVSHEKANQAVYR